MERYELNNCEQCWSCAHCTDSRIEQLGIKFFELPYCEIEDLLMTEVYGEKCKKYVKRSKVQDFYNKHCKSCGSQRCLGIDDHDWGPGCKYYNEFIQN